jgi:hypothetical protein
MPEFVVTPATGALSLCHTFYWNFLEDVCLMALQYVGELAVYGMLHLAFFTVWWTTASIHTAQRIAPWCEQNV